MAVKPPLGKNMPMKDLKRFMASYEERDGHWIWVGRTTRYMPSGKRFPTFWYGGREYSARRAAYIIRHGTIPEGQHLTPACGEYMCVNPDHQKFGRGGALKPKLDRETCKRGHPWLPENLYQYKNRVMCKVCRREDDRRRYERDPDRRLQQKRSSQRRAKRKAAALASD